MNVKEAVKLSVEHVSDLFEHEKITNLGLEEIEFDVDMNEWVVTVGFSRPWDYPQNTLAALAGQAGRPNRSFKIVRINNNNSEVESIKNREVNE